MKKLKSFFKSQLNLTLFASLVLQIVLIGTGKTEFNEGTGTAIITNAVGLLYRMQDNNQKLKAKDSEATVMN